MNDPLVCVHADTPVDVIHEALEQLYGGAELIPAMFRLRSPDHGGQREQFHVCGRWLAQRDPALLLRHLHEIPQHGTYKDILAIGAGTPIEHAVLEFYAHVLVQDLAAVMRGKSPTSAAKYAPMPHNVLDESHNLVSKITKVLRSIGAVSSVADYRKRLIKPIRAVLALQKPSVYAAIRHGDAITPMSLAPPRELIAYYLSAKPYNQRVEDQYRMHVAAARPLQIPRPELAHVLAHVLLFLDTDTSTGIGGTMVMLTTTRYNMINLNASLEEKTRRILAIYDPAGTYVEIRGRVYDLGIGIMLDTPTDVSRITG